MSKQFTLRKSLIATVVASALGAVMMPGSAWASEADVLKKIEALQAAIDAQNAEIAALKAQVKATSAAAPAMAPQTAGKAMVTSIDGLTIYGKLELVATNNDDGKDTRSYFNNISSNIGFRGQRRFSDDLSGIMQVETGIAVDDDTNSKAFASRNSYVGVDSKSAGRFFAGKYDMPLKMLSGYANPGNGEMDVQEVVIHGRGTSVAAGASWSNVHTRQTNVFQYWSPKFADSFTVKAAYSPGGLTNENLPTTAIPYKKPVYGASVEFKSGMFQAGLASERLQNFSGDGKDNAAWKATAGMDLGAARFGLTYSSIDNHNGKQTDNWLIGGYYKLSDKWKLAAEYAQSSETAGGANDGLTVWGLEADYLMDKNTKLYLQYLQITNEAKAQGSFFAGDNRFVPLPGNDPLSIGLGIRYNF